MSATPRRSPRLQQNTDNPYASVNFEENGQPKSKTPVGSKKASPAKKGGKAASSSSISPLTVVLGLMALIAVVDCTGLLGEGLPMSEVRAAYVKDLEAVPSVKAKSANICEDAKTYFTASSGALTSSRKKGSMGGHAVGLLSDLVSTASFESLVAKQKANSTEGSTEEDLCKAAFKLGKASIKGASEFAEGLPFTGTAGYVAETALIDSFFIAIVYLVYVICGSPLKKKKD